MITVDGYPLDLVETEEHSLESEITDFPVEQGSDLTDNIRQKPRELTLTNAVVSDTPIGAVAQDPTRSPNSGLPLPSADAYSRLEKIHEAGEPVTVVTGLKKYENMGLRKLTVPKESKTLKALVFTAEFKQLKIVQNKRVTVAIPTAQGKSNLGQRTSALWSKKLGIKNVVFVTTYGKNPDGSIDQKTIATFTKAYGPPLQVDKFGAHWEVTGATRPDGYIKDGVYHPVNATGQDVVKRDANGNPLDSRDKFGNQVSEKQTSFNGRPVHYNYDDQTWRDPDDNSIVKRVQPGENSWNGIKYGDQQPYHDPKFPLSGGG